MKKIYHLGTCNTCQRIIKELEPLAGVELQDIKEEPITTDALDAMVALAGSHEALFSKRARLYTARKLKEKQLSESDMRALILEHYTFLKRPVVVVEDQIFIGNSKNAVAGAKAALHP